MNPENILVELVESRKEDEITDQELESQRENNARISNDKYCEDVAHLCHLATELIIHHGFNLFVNIFTWGGVTISVHTEDKAFTLFDFAKGNDVKEKAEMLTVEYLNSFIREKKTP